MYISLCITTKNRPLQLSVLLESLGSSDCKKYELVVVDSSTNQDSNVIVEVFKRKNPHSTVKYIYKQCSIDEGYFEAAHQSTGEFIWFFSDDDVLTPSAIDALHNLLIKSPLDFLIVNSSLYNHDLSKCEHFSRLDFLKDESGSAENLQSLGELFGKVHGILGYISCILISRTIFNSYLINHDKVSFSKYFHHLHYVFSTDFNDNSAIKWKILSSPLFITRINSNSWIDDYLFIWGIDFQKACRALININNNVICTHDLKANNCSVRFLVASLIHKRGADRFTDYIKKARCSRFFLLLWMIYRILSVLKIFKRSIQ
jgi:glycosyltransferase involved in cell wall biosynthesis